MWYRQLAVLPLIAGLLWLLGGALAQQTPPAAKSATPPPPPPKADPEAIKSLNLALRRFGPKREGWLKTSVWQQVGLQGLTYQANGVYLAGPNQRLRLDLKVQVGGTESEMQVVSDGASLWHKVRVGNDKPIVTKFGLTEVMNLLNAPGTQPQTRNEFLRTQAFQGIEPLLQGLQQLMTFTKQEAGEWKGQKALVLTGTWSADMAKNLGPQDRWLPGMPRKCVVYLDAQTYWPVRLEWWGVSPPKTEDQLLMQMEFRDLKLLKPDEQPPAEFLAMCQFDEKGVEVMNQTKQLTEGLRERNKQLTPKATPPAKK